MRQTTDTGCCESAQKGTLTPLPLAWRLGCGEGEESQTIEENEREHQSK